MSRVKIGRNDPCWCGSGKKYKRCHLDRELHERVTFEEILKGQKAAASLQLCLAQGLDATPCAGGIVKAHSLSRKASLERVARNKHVYGFRGAFTDLVGGNRKPAPRLVGVRQASTFTGFCEQHDVKLFRPVDAQALVPTNEQLWLLSYRSLSREIFGKTVLRRNAPLMREADRGKTLSHQVATQLTAMKFEDVVRGGLADLVHQQKAWHEVIEQKAYQRVSYLLIRFDSTPDVVCSGVSQPNQDFTDRTLLRLDLPETRQDSVAFAVLPTETGAIAFFSWLDEFKEAEEFVRSLVDLPENRICNQLVRYAFETFDDVWLGPDWWEALPESERVFLVERMYIGNSPHPMREPDPYSLVDNGMVFVRWKIRDVQTHIVGPGKGL